MCKKSFCDKAINPVAFVNVQVISAKVVARAKSAKSQRYGFVTMASPEQAEKSIRSLNSTELKGQRITVELVNYIMR